MSQMFRDRENYLSYLRRHGTEIMFRTARVHFRMLCPWFGYSCTFRVLERIWPDLPDHRLNTLAEHIGHQFHHHNARDDARAAGRVLLEMMKKMDAKPLSELLHKAEIVASA